MIFEHRDRPFYPLEILDVGLGIDIFFRSGIDFCFVEESCLGLAGTFFGAGFDLATLLCLERCWFLKDRFLVLGAFSSSKLFRRRVFRLSNL